VTVLPPRASKLGLLWCTDCHALHVQGSGGYDSDGPPGHSSSSSFRGPGAAESARPLSFSRPPATDGSEEAELVDALCTPGGLRAAPEREDLRLFVERIAAVNGTTVADLLRQKMVSYLRRGGRLLAAFYVVSFQKAWVAAHAHISACRGVEVAIVRRGRPER